MVRFLCLFGVAAATFLWAPSALTRAGESAPLVNGDFRQGADAAGVPRGWSKYGGSANASSRWLPDEQVLLMDDQDPAAETGIQQTVAAEPNVAYKVVVKVRALAERNTAGAHVQLRFLPSNEFHQADLATENLAAFDERSVYGLAPSGTTKAVVYLYTHRDPMPKLLVGSVALVAGVEIPPPAAAAPPPPIVPVYQQLKDLKLDVSLVRGGRPAISIVSGGSEAQREAAASIQTAVAERTGVELPILDDREPAAAVPLTRNLIVLGNRSTNRTSNALYDQHYSLMDLKYPGRGGYALRSLHDPCANGWSAILVGASDDAGLREGARKLADLIRAAPLSAGDLTLQWLMETRLGEGLEIPHDLRRFETWEASRGYGSIGYFGWNSISKRMAMYYMTGDEFHAREAIRLSFPDAQALRELDEIDEERIENKQDPLAGPYHYNAMMLILYWDLIEESPVFTAEERLKVTNAFARRLSHPQDRSTYHLRTVPASVGSRHGQWSALSLYTLGRYFNKYYPSPLWAHAERAGQLAFHSLHQHEWVAGESDNLFWYNTGIAPILTYMILSGDRKPLENDVLQTLLRGQELLISGRVPDWALNSAALDFLHKAAYLTGDGRWLVYRDRTGLDTDIFRLGQSFWPAPELRPHLPQDLVGVWTIHSMPRPMWLRRGNGFRLSESFLNASFRSAADETGDFILLDGMNGASRNPYHTFAVLEYRLHGTTLLQGYRNRVLTRADGMVEPLVPMDGAMRYSAVTGPVAVFVGEVPQLPFCSWRRTLVHHTGRYGLIADELEFRADSQNMQITTQWEPVSGRWDPDQQALRDGTSPRLELRPSQVLDVSRARGVTSMDWRGPVCPQERRCTFYLVGQSTDERQPLACLQIAPNAAALALPEPAMVSLGEYRHNHAQIAVLATDHLYGRAMLTAGLADRLLQADAPLEVAWDFAAGRLDVCASQPTELRLRLATAAQLSLDNCPIATESENGLTTVRLSSGLHVVCGAAPASNHEAALNELLHQGRLERAVQLRETRRPEPQPGRLWSAAMQTNVGAAVADLEVVSSAQGVLLAAAAEKRVHLISLKGETVRQFDTDGRIRNLHWWDKPQLLLAGCVDEKLIAFDHEGQRRWTFVSEMAPAVYEAAKQYWFKSAPGHEGIHGLSAGTFLDGQEQCFVGGACTLEIVDADGQLKKRLPLFWGPGSQFRLLPRQDGTTELLVAREPTDGPYLYAVSNRGFGIRRGFDSVPAGHSLITGWANMSRDHIFHVDLDGDGTKEVVSEINGAWNRITVWDEDGRALYNAQFGPGDSIPARNIRDVDILDLDGDGKQEIITATAEGLLVALDHQCRKVWSTRLESPAAVLQARRSADSARVVVGCDDGSVLQLDANGQIIAQGKIDGRPTQIVDPATGELPLVVFATSKGTVAAFALDSVGSAAR